MPKNESPLKTIYRLTVMTGTLGVGSLAAYQYGPPPEQLAEGINHAVSVVNERLGTEADVTQPTDAATPAPRFDDQIVAASFEQPAATPSANAPAAPTVEPWGDEGMHRASVVVETTLGERRFDAIGATPQEATSRLAAEIDGVRRR